MTQFLQQQIFQMRQDFWNRPGRSLKGVQQAWRILRSAR
jgi:hypothetical protein